MDRDSESRYPTDLAVADAPTTDRPVLELIPAPEPTPATSEAGGQQLGRSILDAYRRVLEQPLSPIFREMHSHEADWRDWYTAELPVQRHLTYTAHSRRAYWRPEPEPEPHMRQTVLSESRVRLRFMGQRGNTLLPYSPDALYLRVETPDRAGAFVEGQIRELSSSIDIHGGEDHTIELRTRDGAHVTVEHDLRERTITITERETTNANGLWNCAVGHIDDCASHRYSEGIRGSHFRSFWRPMSTDEAQQAASAFVLVAEALQQAAEPAADTTPPQNRLERRAAASMARRGRPFSRDELIDRD